MAQVSKQMQAGVTSCQNELLCVLWVLGLFLCVARRVPCGTQKDCPRSICPLLPLIIVDGGNVLHVCLACVFVP